MRLTGRGAAAIVGTTLAVAAIAWVVVRGPAPPATFEDRVRGVAQTLRCPVCQDLSVADSPSELARQMRATIAGKLRAGQSPGEIRAFFVRAYSDWILLSPPGRGLGVLTRVAPVGVLLLGTVGVGLVVRRWRRRHSQPAVVLADDGSVAMTAEERSTLVEALASLDTEDEED